MSVIMEEPREAVGGDTSVFPSVGISVGGAAKAVSEVV